jgi:hypothetical protein
MTASSWSPPTKDQVAAANEMVTAIVGALSVDGRVHAETAVAAAARLAGTFLFRSFGFPPTTAPPGSPVLSDAANERGPAVIQTFATVLGRLGVSLENPDLSEPIPEQHRPRLDVVETQRALEPALDRIARAHQLDLVAAAHTAAVAAAILVQRTQSVLVPRLGAALAVYGVVEGSKTMPPPAPQR